MKFKMIKEKGQTLLIIVLLSFLALSVGIVVSNRFIKTLRDVSESDNSSRARAVAEALVERLLIVSNATLGDYINFGSCGTACSLEINGFLGQVVRADATLSFAGASADPFEIAGKNGEVSQITLVSYATNSSLDVCWSGGASVYASYIYDQSGVIAADIYAYNPVGYTGYINNFSDAISSHGYPNCFTVSTPYTPKVLRIRPINADATIIIVPSGGHSLPSQGVLITSIGRAGDAVKTVKVLKSSASAPEYMDFVIYQKSTTDPLSNRPN
ncbi:hypothetical protein KKC62_01095 [Patescibacteria group bacterium]|nr:hypothetical protein [Patescibacteria group bacterium]MBU1952795.1 hypothetical protein [Patescibacteria group bacterium]